jgi:hypothetical protein
MWKLLIKLEGQKEWHTVYGMGMAFEGFHILDQASSFMLKSLDAYVVKTFGKDLEIEEVSLKFVDKV